MFQLETAFTVIKYNRSANPRVVTLTPKDPKKYVTPNVMQARFSLGRSADYAIDVISLHR